MASTRSDAGAHRFAAQYDRLLAELGEDPFRSDAALQRVQDPAKAVAEGATPDSRRSALEALTDKSLRCAELIAQTLEASSTISQLQKKLVGTVEKSQSNEDEDESMSEEEDDSEGDDQDDERAALLLQDLVAAGASVEAAGKQYAQLGVVEKSLRSSRELLASADRDLKAAATSVDSAPPSEFRDLYMEEFTTAFGDSLDQFRQEEQFESKDVAYLISCIHAGGDIFSPLQKKLFIEAVVARSDAEP